MDSQKFDPRIFIKDILRLYGNLARTPLLIVCDFAVTVGDQSKLNQYLKHLKILANGLPPDAAWIIFSLIATVQFQLQAQKEIKPFQIRTKRILEKKKYRFLKKRKD